LPGFEAAPLFPAALQKIRALGKPGAGVRIFSNLFIADRARASAPVEVLVRNSKLYATRFVSLVHGTHRVTDRYQGPTVVLRIAGVSIEVIVAVRLVGIVDVRAVVIGVKKPVAVVIHYGLTEIYTVVVLCVALTLAAPLSAVGIFGLAVIYTDGRSRGDRYDQQEHERQRAYRRNPHKSLLFAGWVSSQARISPQAEDAPQKQETPTVPYAIIRIPSCSTLGKF
jgi:hypothetical protein